MPNRGQHKCRLALTLLSELKEVAKLTTDETRDESRTAHFYARHDIILNKMRINCLVVNRHY